VSARSQLAERLTTLLPKMTVVGTERTPERLTKPTVIVRHRDYTPAGNAQGVMMAGLILELLSHLDDIEKAEDALDEALPTLLAALLEIPDVTWSRAVKITEAERWLGFNIEVNLPVSVS
jgi:hypothetical protein